MRAVWIGYHIYEDNHSIINKLLIKTETGQSGLELDACQEQKRYTVYLCDLCVHFRWLYLQLSADDLTNDFFFFYGFEFVTLATCHATRLLGFCSKAV